LFAFWYIINVSFDPAPKAGVVDDFYIKNKRFLPNFAQVRVYAEKFKNYAFPGSTPRLLNKILQISNFPVSFYVTPSMY